MRRRPAFYEIEDSWDGFEWIAANDADRNIVAYLRQRQGAEYVPRRRQLLRAQRRKGIVLGVPKGKYKVVFNTDHPKFGGNGELKKRIFNTERKPSHGKEHSIKIEVPKLSCVYLQKIL